MKVEISREKFVNSALYNLVHFLVKLIGGKIVGGADLCFRNFFSLKNLLNFYAKSKQSKKVRRILTVGKMWCKFSLTGLLRTRIKCVFHSKQCNRLYHYKPKDKVVGDGGPLTENVANKDLILFRYEDPQKMMRRAAMAASCFLMGGFIGHTFYGVGDLVKDGVERGGKKDGKDLMYYTAERVSYAGLIGAFSLFGLGAYGLSRVMYSVRRLILRKGGKNVTLVTYGLFGVNSKHVTVPLSSVSLAGFAKR